MDEFQVELFIPTLAQLPLGLTGVANLVTAFFYCSEISKIVSFGTKIMAKAGRELE
ncbi:hypothetical protein AM1_1535 [Acaryochloris marina MBIC11017]|uniref:Uncharacterized protein n=1 Tax=Acaryochloris marina (strain MBIC 11017) TaxID=329726 RepID=B0C925_ACAM1|nr:hypothetical protein AM1_1535 [Acaryochloris marina MBIC11017]